MCYITDCVISIQVFEKLQQAEKMTKEIEQLRDGYRPAARRGAVLFFVLSEMAAINTMYQYSLNAYLTVFNHSLHHSLPDSHLPKRLKYIIDTLTLNVYNYACTGMSIYLFYSFIHSFTIHLFITHTHTHTHTYIYTHCL